MMRKLILCIIIFLSSTQLLIACGFSFYGDVMRYSFLTPKYLNFPYSAGFYYNAYGFSVDYPTDEFDRNIYAWQKVTKNSVSLDSIKQFLYHESYEDITSTSDNDFLKYLFKNHKNECIDYLKLAKSIEGLNAKIDPWERHQNVIREQRDEAIQKIEKKLHGVKNSFFQRRYSFLIIRLSYYNGNTKQIEHYFNHYFSNSSKDFLYYWGLYFYCFTPQATSIDYANVLSHSFAKRQASYYNFNKKFVLSKALSEAKNNQEKANAYCFSTVQKLAPALDDLKMIYQLDPQQGLLGFLLIREINKLEDWIYTPYYTNYLPIGRFNSWDSQDKFSTISLRNRSEKDRLYAQKVLDFVDNMDLNTVKNPKIWRAARIQLLFMTKKYTACIEHATTFIQRYPKDKIIQEIYQIKALSITANQPKGKAIIKDEVKRIILKNLDQRPFLFALGRELEYLGNLPDAIALISYQKKDKPSYDEDVYWRANRLKSATNLIYFYTYFNYLDVVYGAQQLQTVIEHINHLSKDKFTQTIYQNLEKDKDYLDDMLGTKYVRINQLKKALSVYQGMPKEYWQNNYNAWGRGKYGHGNRIFDANPFYDLKNTPSFITTRKDFHLSKISVLEHLIDFISKGKDGKDPKQAYYNFLVATCYFNFTQYGNSWMMRRISSTRRFSLDQSSYVDEKEYRKAELAQKYYHLAYQQAKSKKFKALCYRMEEWVKNLSHYSLNYPKLAKKYPEFSKDLSYCYSLEEYFKPQFTH